jgi:hypothetical protein
MSWGYAEGGREGGEVAQPHSIREWFLNTRICAFTKSVSLLRLRKYVVRLFKIASNTTYILNKASKAL